jgi:hypothetical protein
VLKTLKELAKRGASSAILYGLPLILAACLVALMLPWWAAPRPIAIRSFATGIFIMSSRTETPPQ